MASPLIDLEDRVAVTKVWMTEMPPQVFNGLKLSTKKAAVVNWVELTQRGRD